MANDKDRAILVPKYFRITPEQPTRDPAPSYGGGLYFGIFLLVIAALVIFSEMSCLAALLFPIGLFMTVKAYSDLDKETKSLEKAHQGRMSKYRKEYDAAEPKPSDVQMDTWLAEDIEELKRYALEKMDLNDEDMLHGPDDPDMPIVVIGPGKDANVAIGKDGFFRFSIYDILLVFLTNYHLAAYKCSLDFATKRKLFESTQEYHYMDVVSVSTKTVNEFTLTVNDEIIMLGNSQQFALSVASGESIGVATPTSLQEVRNVRNELKNGKFPDSGADRAIRTIRSRLREKKGGAVG